MKSIKFLFVIIFCTVFFNLRAQNENEENSEENAVEEQNQEPQDIKPASVAPTLQSYSKFDFIPGAKVIFYDDFTESAVGDFPSSWNTNASGEVVTTNLYPGNWFKMSGSGCIALDEGLKLPDNYRR
jgi:OOP family OmpA-OmpF porin